MMSYQPFWEDDLPNLFGINPIEGAVIFGALYYLYGPEELYKYAREVGKAFGTYAPIARDLAVNIFNEFKDYVEEDRQRDEMKSRGIDISKIPRRTTNVIERISESISMFSEMTTVSGGMTEEIQSGLRPEIFTAAATTATSNSEQVGTGTSLNAAESSSGTVDVLERAKQRKSKKKVLEAKNIDVDKIIEVESKMAGDTDMLTQAELNKSLNLVQDRIELLAAARQKEIADKGLFGDSSPSGFSRMTPNAGTLPVGAIGSMGGSVMEPGLGLAPGFPESPMTGDFNADGVFVPFTASAPAEQSASGSSTVGDPSAELSRFQQQLSGQWNQQVLQQETVATVPVQTPVEQGASSVGMGADTTAGMSRFQQQLSGQWNQQVLQQEQSQAYSPAAMDGSAVAAIQSLQTPFDGPAYIFPSDVEQEQEEIFDEYGFPLPPSAAFMSRYSTDPVQGLPDLDAPAVPQAVRMVDSPSTKATTTSSTVSAPVSSNGSVAPGSLTPTAEALLAELDRDYSQLRQRLLSAIVTLEQQKLLQPSVQAPIAAPDTTMKAPDSSQSTSGDRKSYWPPQKRLASS